MSEDHMKISEKHIENRTGNVNENTEDGYAHKFTGYGSQSTNQHPFYHTTSKEYGWFPPDYHTAPSVYYPTQQRFSSYLAAAGMYRNHSLNTSMDPPPYK